jgi:hypothetical protein
VKVEGSVFSQKVEKKGAVRFDREIAVALSIDPFAHNIRARQLCAFNTTAIHVSARVTASSVFYRYTGIPSSFELSRYNDCYDCRDSSHQPVSFFRRRRRRQTTTQRRAKALLLTRSAGCTAAAGKAAGAAVAAEVSQLFSLS